jgi:hypothetical protein
VSAADLVIAVEASTATVVASYDLLRRAALGCPGLKDGPPLGFAIALRQGMAAWLHAWATCPRPRDPSIRAAPPLALPSLVHTEFTQLWAHMALSHQEAAWI